VSPSPATPDVAIVGAGVIGLGVAWRAQERGLSTVVIDRAAPGSATSRVAAGMIAPIAEAEPTEPGLLALARDSARRYPQFAKEVEARSGIDPGYRRFGTLLVARDDDEAAALERELAFRGSLGLPVRRLLPSQARSLEPALAPTIRLGLEIPDDHAIDPRALTAALEAAHRRAGGRLMRAEVESLTVREDRVVGVRLAGGEEIAAPQVVIAAGPWSGEIQGLPASARVPLRPVKGQLLVLRDPSGAGLVQRVIRMQPGYLVPRGDGRYVLGASVEERGFDTTVTVAAVFELLRDAVELVPGLSELVIEELLAGIRPGTPDNAPILGRGALPGLVWATGHYRHGVLLAPITAELIAGVLTGEDPGPFAAPFAPDRFGGSRWSPAPVAGVAA
jgi:glycine oxidase